MQDVLSLILGGGRGTRLYPLTKLRSKPAVPVAGKYRLIDIPISNCINSGLNRIYVLTQFLSVSLHRHIANTYKFDPFSRGFVEVLAAQQTNEAADWYQGTADAVRQNIRYVAGRPAATRSSSSPAISSTAWTSASCIQTHRDSKADVTIAVLPVAEDQVSGFGIVRLDDDRPGHRLRREAEDRGAARAVPHAGRAGWSSAASPAQGRDFLASMGIYLFKREALLELLDAPPLATDFGKEIFPRSIGDAARPGPPVRRLLGGPGHDQVVPRGEPGPGRRQSAVRFPQPGGRHLHAHALPAGLARQRGPAGAVPDQRRLRDRAGGDASSDSVVGVRSRIGRDVHHRATTVIIGADRFETDAERAANRRRGVPDLTIGDGSVIERAILDKDCRIGSNVRIVNTRNVQDEEGDELRHPRRHRRHPQGQRRAGRDGDLNEVRDRLVGWTSWSAIARRAVTPPPTGRRTGRSTLRVARPTSTPFQHPTTTPALRARSVPSSPESSAGDRSGMRTGAGARRRHGGRSPSPRTRSRRWFPGSRR